MRPRHSVSAAALIAALLAPGIAAAQPPGWIDPPSKDSAAKDSAAKEPSGKDSSVKGARPAGTASSAPSAPAADEAPAAKRSVASGKPPAETKPPADSKASAQSRPAATAEARAAHAEPHRHRVVRAAPARTARPPETFAQGAPALPPDPEARSGERGDTARHLASAYLASLSAPNAVTIAAAPRFYADRIQFHGRTMTLSALMQEKRRFTQRWPERRYVPDTGAMRTACDAATATCTVRTPLVFSASNRARGARSTGVAELVMTVSFAGGRPVIVAESSRVLRRGVATVGPVRPADQGA